MTGKKCFYFEWQILPFCSIVISFSETTFIMCRSCHNTKLLFYIFAIYKPLTWHGFLLSYLFANVDFKCSQLFLYYFCRNALLFSQACNYHAELNYKWYLQWIGHNTFFADWWGIVWNSQVSVKSILLWIF